MCKKIQNYRKALIVNIPNLKFLDDRPVFPEDRRFAEAFARGGLQEEREKRKKWDREKEDERMRNHLAFREMIKKCRSEIEERKNKVKSILSTDESKPEGSSGSQVWSSSTDGENDVVNARLQTVLIFYYQKKKSGKLTTILLIIRNG